MSIAFRDEALEPIWERIQTGDRLSLEEGRVLMATKDLLSLGKMAHFAQQKRSGDAVYFVLNQKIEPTNVCVLDCRFCDFAVKAGAPAAYEMSIQEMLDKLTPDIHEVHITGGLHPTWDWNFYLEMLRQIRHAFPNVDVKAFTAVEIDFFSRKFKFSIPEILRQLKEAGLRTMPGGGAEVFSERVRKELFHQKIGADVWLDVHRTAHRMGIPSNCTLLYGHIETTDERLGHLIRLRALQDETGGFLSFIPLAFQPGDTGIKPKNDFTSAIDDLKMIAVSRLMLDNIPHIKAYWVMLTEEVAAVALNFGADDMDGTVGGERIAHDAGATSASTLAKDRIIRIIRDAGKIPVERDAFYNPLHLHAGNVIGKIPYLNSVPFYEYFEQRRFKVLPVTPRRMGILAKNGELAAGLFSLMDYLDQRENLELLGTCIATRDQVKSVLLFSDCGWSDLEGKTIGIIDDTATSVQLLRVLLEKKYGVRATFQRMQSGINDYSIFDAILVIGDEALRQRNHPTHPFEIEYDLATEWYDWMGLPFVFAVWAVSTRLSADERQELQSIVEAGLTRGLENLETVGALHSRRISYTLHDTVEYLQGIHYRLGDRERLAIERFASFVSELDKVRS